MVRLPDIVTWVLTCELRFLTAGLMHMTLRLAKLTEKINELKISIVLTQFEKHQHINNQHVLLPKRFSNYHN